MKYGILLNRNNLNIGDDIQAYATARFLPSFDYMIDREHMDEFRTENEEPVAVIMNAWYMWAKWNWPPSKYIYPCFVGFHYADHQLAGQPGSPFKYEFLTGIGAEYLKAYAPIGCRDYFTMEQLQRAGIPAYFSGCITLTLPKMPAREDRGSYICLVDLDKPVVRRIREMLADENIEIKEITHNRERNKDMTWEEREQIVVDLLTLYQNARCVVTKRLHCALPCLAMEVPVLLIKMKDDDIRFTPYYDYLHRVKTDDFLKGEGMNYDFMNPPQNKDMYREVREQLIRTARQFVERTKDINCSAGQISKTTYSDEDVLKWRHDLMKVSMDQWLVSYREIQIRMKDMEKYRNSEKKRKRLADENKQLRSELATVCAEAERLKSEGKKAEEERKKKDRELKEKNRMLNYRLVRLALKIRRIGAKGYHFLTGKE